MNQNSTESSTGRLLSKSVLAVLLLAVLFVVLLFMPACSALPESGSPPTFNSPVQTLIPIATQIAVMPLPTRALKPTPTGIEFATPEPINLVPIPGSTPAGAGAIVKIQPPFSNIMYHIENTWYKDLDSRTRLYVYVGSVSAPGGGYTDQGVVIIHILSSTGEFLHTSQYLTPEKLGPVRIVGAVGDRLILQSTRGAAFYFDVPLRQFVPSLTWVSPIPTPSPQPAKP